MKVRQRLAAAVVAAATLGSMMVPTGAGAAYNCDVNRDGVVNVLDTIAINRYLAGLFYVNNPAIMDADGNQIINAADSICVQAHTIGLTYTYQFVNIMDAM